MKKYLVVALALLGMLLSGVPALAQSHTVTARLVEESTGEAVPFATVSLTPKGSEKVYKYVL
ncbi:MAG: hypothetical protein IIT74_00685, partial [Bacteroidales bacterium]|nr:hypothetical protein [Bacteroidales bacterium]